MSTILRFPEVCKLTKLARSTIYDMMARDEFPRPIQLTQRAVGWKEDVVKAWCDKRPQAVHRVYRRASGNRGSQPTPASSAA